MQKAQGRIPGTLTASLLIGSIFPLLACAAQGGGATSGEPEGSTAQSAPISVLIIDGVSNHDWQSTTAATRTTLERSGRFVVDVSTSPEMDAPAEEWAAWRPDFFAYDVVVSNFNDNCSQEGGCEPLWSAEMMADFDLFVRDGGGFVAIHAADNHAASWPEYNRMIGVGGWGGRRAGLSGYLLRLVDGEWMPTSPDEGISGEHGAQREFIVVHDRPDHPILAGLPGEWMHATDELYSGLRGPAENVEVLAHAYSLYTNENEPVYMLIPYGGGRVFHIALGHYDNRSEPPGVAVQCVGYQTLLARGTEYVATGKVTLGIPAGFPGVEAASATAPSELVW